MDRNMSAALDRYITGNYGEDSVSDMPPTCEKCQENKIEKCLGQRNCIEVILDCHPACCLEHRIEMDGGNCGECEVDVWVELDTNLMFAKDRVRVLKAGLTAKYPKRIEKLYLEQERIKIIKKNVLKEVN